MKSWFYFLALYFILYGVNGCSPKDSINPDIHLFWKKMLRLAGSSNTARIKEVSLPFIYCKGCSQVLNEDSISSLYFNNIDPKRLNQDLEYVPIDTFIKNDLTTIFSKALIKKGKDRSKIAIVMNELNFGNKPQYLEDYLEKDQKYRLYEVLITTKDPSTLNQGVQEVFEIIETKDGLKFYGYSSSP